MKHLRLCRWALRGIECQSLYSLCSDSVLNSVLNAEAWTSTGTWLPVTSQQMKSARTSGQRAEESPERAAHPGHHHTGWPPQTLFCAGWGCRTLRSTKARVSTMADTQEERACAGLHQYPDSQINRSSLGNPLSPGIYIICLECCCHAAASRSFMLS